MKTKMIYTRRMKTKKNREKVRSKYITKEKRMKILRE